ncbi:MAG: CcmD family protein [Raoultibacter sp.]
MNAVLAEIYSTILPAAPYVIGAYALIWLALFVYVFFIMRKVHRAEAHMAILEEAIAEKADLR